MAAPTIINTTQIAGDECIEVLNGAWARPISISPLWTKIRIGARVGAGDSLGVPWNDTGGIGLSKGTTNILGDASTDWFIGCYLDNASIAYGNLYTVAAIKALSREGTTNTLGGTNLAANGGLGNVGVVSAYLSGWLVDITKVNAISTKVDFWHISNQTLTSAQFLGVMETATPAGYTHGTEQTLAHTQSTDDLDAISCYFSHPTIGFYLFDVAVAILA